MIYLDNAATTYPLPECVCDEMDRVNRSLSVNAGRGSYRLATQASKIIDGARSELARLIGIDDSSRVIFSASATLAANQALGGRSWDRNDVVYVSPFEHNAVLRPLFALKERYGFEVYELPLISGSMEIDLKLMRDMFSLNRPSLVCCTHVSNVTGYILPIEQIGETAKEYGAEILVDASQSAGLIKTDMGNIDFLIFAGHKTLYGPFGAGGVILGRNVRLRPFISGGTGSISLDLRMPEALPSGYEPGSMNISAIAGLGTAVRYIKDTGVDRIYRHEKELTESLINGLSSIRGVQLYLPPDLGKHIGIVSFNVEGYTADECGRIFDSDFDIAVRTGYHCAAFIHKYLEDKPYLGTVRASVGWFTSQEDVDRLVEAVRGISEE